MKVQAVLDLANNQLINAIAETVAGNPSSPSDGRFWYDSTNSTFKVQIGGVTIDLRSRANHTGTQLASTISNFDTQVRTSRLDQMTAPTASVGMNSQQFSSLATASGSGQAVEYSQFQTALTNIQAGLDFKEHVDIVATANVTISSPGAAINGRTMVNGDRVLLPAQTTTSQAGLWVWNGAAVPMTRPTDAPTGNTGAVVAGTVVEGYNASTRVLYMQTSTGTGTNGAIIVDTDAQTWTNPYPAITLTNGYGTTASGTQINANAGTGISIPSSAGSSIAVDTTVVARKVTGVVPTATSGIYTVGSPSGGFTPVTINHALSNWGVELVSRYYTSPGSGNTSGARVLLDSTSSDANNLVVQLPTGYAANQYYVSIVG